MFLGEGAARQDLEVRENMANSGKCEAQSYWRVQWKGGVGQDKAAEGARARSCRALNARLGSLVYPEANGSHGRALAGEGHNQRGDYAEG